MNEREKISKIIESEQITARQFAAEIGVSAGTISNILSGRNNASLDIIVRILNRYRTISSDWLVLDTGSMYRPNGGVTQTSLFGEMRPLLPDSCVQAASAVESASVQQAPLQAGVTEASSVRKAIASDKKAPASNKQVHHIVIFYTDGTYEER